MLLWPDLCVSLYLPENIKAGTGWNWLLGSLVCKNSYQNFSAKDISWWKEIISSSAKHTRWCCCFSGSLWKLARHCTIWSWSQCSITATQFNVWILKTPILKSNLRLKNHWTQNWKMLLFLTSFVYIVFFFFLRKWQKRAEFIFRLNQILTYILEKDRWTVFGLSDLKFRLIWCQTKHF